MDQLEEKSLAYSDTEFAKIMEKEKLKLDFLAALPRSSLKEGAETFGFCDN
jgi:hypothetical protein